MPAVNVSRSSGRRRTGSNPEATSPIDLRLLFAYPIRLGEMRRAIAREQEERRTQDRFASTLVIAASIIAAVRLAREDNQHTESTALEHNW
jgi:hypothetical protein